MTRPTVTTGSMVETMLAVDGPTRARPSVKAVTAPTVEISASATIHAQPAAAKRTSLPPVSRPAVHIATAAPVVTSAPRRNGSKAPTTTSVTRM